jgi:hypothetical protein
MARLHPVFYISLLKLWYELFAFQGFQLGLVQILEDDISTGDWYEVEGILEHRDTVARGREYKVKWLGWLVEEATWEPTSHLDYCEEILNEYYRSPKDALWRRNGEPAEHEGTMATPKTWRRTQKLAARRGGKSKL